MAQLKDTVVNGNIELTGNITLQNAKSIYGIDADGVARQNLQSCNGNNNCVIGYGNYALDSGNTHLYGVAVKVYTKDTDFQVSNIQLARTDTETITNLASGWANYGSSATAPVVRRYGKVVSLTGSLTNTESVTLNSSHTLIFTIPSGYRPSQEFVILCQGSGANEFCVQIKTDGGVYFGRYGTTSFSSIAAGAWFPFHATWVME